MWPKKIGKIIRSGEIYNEWTVIEEIPIDDRKDKKERSVLAQCSCGFIGEVGFKNIKYGKSKTCKKCRLKKSNIASKKQWVPIDTLKKYGIESSLIEIPLTQGKTTLIDKDDYEKIKDYKWCYNIGYAMTHIKRKCVVMHRIINNTPDGMCTDHIDGNKLNNTRSNLRTVSRADHLKHHYEYINSFRVRKKYDITI